MPLSQDEQGQSLIDSSDNQLKRLGHDLMRETKKLFAEYARCRDGTINHAALRRNLQPVRKNVEGLLLAGSAPPRAACAGNSTITKSTCGRF